MKKLMWYRSPTGNFISHGTRFLVRTDLPTRQGVCRVVLRDRVGLKETLPDGSAAVREVDYLCLTPQDAMDLAEHLLAGRGVLAR